MESKPEHRALDLASEVGELSKEILKLSDYGKKSIEVKGQDFKALENELGDVLFSLMTIANYFDISLEEALEMVLKKYEKRTKKGGAGSEHELH